MMTKEGYTHFFNSWIQWMGLNDDVYYYASHFLLKVHIDRRYALSVNNYMLILLKFYM